MSFSTKSEGQEPLLPDKDANGIELSLDDQMQILVKSELIWLGVKDLSGSDDKWLKGLAEIVRYELLSTVQIA